MFTLALDDARVRAMSSEVITSKTLRPPQFKIINIPRFIADIAPLLYRLRRRCDSYANNAITPWQISVGLATGDAFCASGTRPRSRARCLTSRTWWINVSRVKRGVVLDGFSYSLRDLAQHYPRSASQPPHRDRRGLPARVYGGNLLAMRWIVVVNYPSMCRQHKCFVAKMIY